MIRWGIIGCGNVTEVKSGPAFALVPDSALVAVMRRSGELAADYARRHGVPRWYDDGQKLIDDPEVNAVYIATPPGSHLEYAVRCAAAGKPAYVEKPMARNFAECAQMVGAFARADVKLFVAYYRRALPRFVRVRELLLEGAIGQITQVHLQLTQPTHRHLAGGQLPWRLQAEHSGGGNFLDLASHMLDVLDWLLGPLADVQGHAANLACPHDVEDTVAMSFRIGEGVPGTGVWNFAGDINEEYTLITGTEGRIRYSCFDSRADLEITRNGQTTPEAHPFPRHVQQPLIEMVVNDLLGRGSCPSTGETAARTSAVMDAALEGYYGGRQRPFWLTPASWPGRRVD